MSDETTNVSLVTHEASFLFPSNNDEVYLGSVMPLHLFFLQIAK